MTDQPSTAAVVPGVSPDVPKEEELTQSVSETSAESTAVNSTVEATGSEQAQEESAAESHTEQATAEEPSSEASAEAAVSSETTSEEKSEEKVESEETTETAAESTATEKSSAEETSETPESSTDAEPPKDLPWYVVHTYSGFEGRVKLTLEERIRNNQLQEKFGKIIVPQETVVELVRGEKKTSTRKFFPGYMLIQCTLDDETWHLVKDTPKVTGFVGNAHSPLPLTAQEVQNLFEQMEGGAKRPRPKVQFEDGDSVKVIDGPFADFNGVVDEVKPDKGKLRVLISIFGRNTPVELDFVQVEKV